MLLSASADATARIWRAGDNNTYSAIHTLKVCSCLLPPVSVVPYPD